MHVYIFDRDLTTCWCKFISKDSSHFILPMISETLKTNNKLLYTEPVNIVEKKNRITRQLSQVLIPVADGQQRDLVQLRKFNGINSMNKGTSMPCKNAKIQIGNCVKYESKMECAKWAVITSMQQLGVASSTVRI